VDVLSTCGIPFLIVFFQSLPFSLDPQPSSFEVAQRGRIKVRFAIYDIKEFTKNNGVLNPSGRYPSEIVFLPNDPPVIHARRFQTGWLLFFISCYAFMIPIVMYFYFQLRVWSAKRRYYDTSTQSPSKGKHYHQLFGCHPMVLPCISSYLED
jgi:hypothetical protein